MVNDHWSWRYSVIPLEGSEEAVNKKLEHWATSQPGNFCSSQCIPDRPKIKTNNQN